MPGFGTAARKRQAEFRTHSSTISEQGRSPSDPVGQRNGHLLALGCEEENLYPALRGADGARKFFRERNIKWHRTSRSGDAPGVDAPTRNMASSQVACVNFLLPLGEMLGALAAAVRAIDGDVKDVVDLCHEDRASPVEFEWVGLGRSLEGDTAPTRGANSTSVDALVVADTGAGRRAYIMEWKYVEEYRVDDDKGAGRSGETRRRRYAYLYDDASSSFNGVVPMDELLYEPFYQIMRLRLLADRMVAEREFGISDAKVVVVAPNENVAYRERITSPPLARRFPGLKTVEAIVRAALKRPDAMFATVDAATLAGAVARECGPAAAPWVEYQRRRYG